MKKTSISKMLTQPMIEEFKPKVDHSDENLLKLISLLVKLNSANEQKLTPLEDNIKKIIQTVPLSSCQVNKKRFQIENKKYPTL